MKFYNKEQYTDKMNHIIKTLEFINADSFDYRNFRVVKNMYKNNYSTYWIFEYIDGYCVAEKFYEITKNEYETLCFVFNANKTR